MPSTVEFLATYLAVEVEVFEDEVDSPALAEYRSVDQGEAHNHRKHTSLERYRRY